MNQDLRFDLHTEIPGDTALRQEWNALVLRLERPQVFFTWEWAVAVQRAYHATLRPLLFLAYDARDSLCGIAALACDLEGRQVTFLCATTGDYCDFLSSPEDKPLFVSGVLEELRKQGIGDITLTNIPADSGTVAAIRQACSKSGYRCFARTAYICAQVSLQALERRPADNRPVLPGKKKVRRYLNAMSREAPITLDHAQSWDVVEPIVPKFIQLHVARFLAIGRISNMARPERQVFLKELARLLCARGWLALTRLMSGKNVYAWNYGFRFQDTWFWYQPTFDSAVESYSPGFCLLAKIIEEAADNPELKLVDLGLGAEEYKDRFSNQTRKTLCVTLKASAARHYRGVLRYHAAEALRTIPEAEAAARAVLGQLQRIRQHNNIASWMGKRFRELLWAEDEVIFYEWCGTAIATSPVLEIRTLDLNVLADATLQYVDDEATASYLLRAAARLQHGDAEGFVLVDRELADEDLAEPPSRDQGPGDHGPGNQGGSLLHFAWVTVFDGFFLSELNAKVDAPSPGCIMIFDCWTPPAVRGHGYYAQTVSRIAHRMQLAGKKPWIFSAASNLASVRGLEKAGFQRRYSLVRQRALWWQRIKGKTPASAESSASEVSAHV